MQKLLTISIIAALSLTLVTASLVLGNDAQAVKLKPDKVKKAKNVKCNAIKVLVKVNGVEENQTYTANVTLGTGQKQKTGTAEVNETSITLPVVFKKVQPCPSVGFPIGGDVNGTEINGQITSLKKPNKVSVDLP